MKESSAMILALFCALLASLGQTFFKLGSNQVSADIMSWIKNWQVILGMILYGSSALLFIIALKFGRLSILYPLISTSYIWVTLISGYYLGEKINYINYIGITLIILGVAIISSKGM